jgi:GT2 family glycosyltransferase
MENTIAILIIFFNKLQETSECVESFLPSGQPIYVLNNGSDKSLWKKLKNQFENEKSIKFFNSNENLGPAKGRNYLINASKEKWLFLVDNDISIQPEKGWVKAFDEFRSLNPDAAIFCPKLFNIHENEYCSHPEFILKEGEVTLHYKQNYITNYFPSGAAIVDRQIFKQFGLFDDFLTGFEDYEYAIRMLCTFKQPLSCLSIDSICLMHNHRHQKNTADRLAVKTRYNEDNLLRSFRYIEKKYGIIFIHDWQWWSRNQVEKMTANKWKLKIFSVLKRIRNIG